MHDARKCLKRAQEDSGGEEYGASSAKNYCLGKPRSTIRIPGYLDWSLGFLGASHFPVSLYPAALVCIGHVDRSRAHDAAVKPAVAELGLSGESIAARPCESIMRATQKMLDVLDDVSTVYFSSLLQRGLNYT